MIYNLHRIREKSSPHTYVTSLYGHGKLNHVVDDVSRAGAQTCFVGVARSAHERRRDTRSTVDRSDWIGTIVVVVEVAVKRMR